MEAFNSFFYTLFQMKHTGQMSGKRKRKGENNEEVWKGSCEVSGIDPDLIRGPSGSRSNWLL